MIDARKLHFFSVTGAGLPAQNPACVIDTTMTGACTSGVFCHRIGPCGPVQHHVPETDSCRAAPRRQGCFFIFMTCFYSCTVDATGTISSHE